MKTETRRIVQALNEDLALELAGVLQYLHHHWTGEGMESQTILPLFKTVALDEMKHAGKIAERINYLGGDPTLAAAEVKKGGDLRQMIQDDLEGENAAIVQYRKHVRLFQKLGDSTSRLMMEEILSDEERHADIWETTLGVRKE